LNKKKKKKKKKMEAGGEIHVENKIDLEFYTVEVSDQCFQ
jgi:hypothetical protein